MHSLVHCIIEQGKIKVGTNHIWLPVENIGCWTLAKKNDKKFIIATCDEKSIAAIDFETGSLLGKITEYPSKGFVPWSVCTDGGRYLFAAAV